jgi:hypothetical protein
LTTKKFEHAALTKMDKNYSVFANRCWEMLLKLIRQPLGTAKSQKSSWEMPKD